MDTQELKNYVLRQLGSPKVNVELTEAQIVDAINDAIFELQPWLSIRRYITVPNSNCIDMTEHKAINVTDVQEVYNPNEINNPTSIFSQNITPNSALVDLSFIPYNSNIHDYVTTLGRARRETFYGQLASITRKKIADSILPHTSFKFIKPKLYLSCNSPYVTIEYTSQIDTPEDLVGDDMNTRKFVKYLKDLSVSFSRILQSRITGKYKDTNTPVTIDSDRIEKNAQADIDRIRTELRQQGYKFFISN